MGLGTFKTAWQRQVQYFGHELKSKYTCLIFDNRGMGESDKPLARYSTSEMAKDTMAVVDHLDWKSPRQLHVVGVSMGGMIAQELVGAFRTCRSLLDKHAVLTADSGTEDTREDSFTDTCINRGAPRQHCGKYSIELNPNMNLAAKIARDTGRTSETESTW